MSGAPPAFRRALPLLRCPQCGAPFAETGSGVRCESGHSFDRAKQGHLTLFGPRGRRFPGDTALQVASRERFFSGGWYTPVVDAVADALGEAVDETAEGTGRPVIAEFGAGTGTYLAAALHGLRRAGTEPLGIGTEMSVSAARRLARADADLAAIVADTWEPLPLAGESLDALAVVFAPRNVAEFARVLRPGGVAVVAVPGEGHLEPLRTDLGMLGAESGKTARLADDFAGWEALPVRDVDVTIDVTSDAARDLALMGPSGVHLEEAALDEAIRAAMPGGGPVGTRVHVEVHAFRASRVDSVVTSSDA